MIVAEGTNGFGAGPSVVGRWFSDPNLRDRLSQSKPSPSIASSPALTAAAGVPPVADAPAWKLWSWSNDAERNRKLAIVSGVVAVVGAFVFRKKLKSMLRRGGAS
jgi:hypothetical protein